MRVQWKNCPLLFVVLMGAVCVWKNSPKGIFSSWTETAPPLTILPNAGRLGNQMFSLATLVGLGRLNGREVALLPETHAHLRPYFDLRVSTIQPIAPQDRKPWPIGFWLSPQDASLPLSTNCVAGNLYPTSYTFFHRHRAEVRALFRFKPLIRGYVRSFFDRLTAMRPWTQTIVGIHVRRGDYLKKGKGGWLRAADGREVDLPYFRRALDHFRGRHANVTFLAVSEDRHWCRRHLAPLGVLTAPDSPTPGHDLALLAACDHLVMTYGTYGFWAGYLGGGEVVYFADFVRPNTTVARKYFVYEKMYPPEWLGISTTPPGYWESYTNPFEQ